MIILEDSEVMGRTAIILDKKEGKRLIDILDAACAAHTRKRSWKDFRKRVVDILACY